MDKVDGPGDHTGSREVSMPELIKEERYLFFLGTKEHVLRVQELLWGSTGWPEKFRIHVHASYNRDGKNFYGATAREAVERAIEYLSSQVHGTGPSPVDLHASN
jgi:hypothetical protein